MKQQGLLIPVTVEQDDPEKVELGVLCEIKEVTDMLLRKELEEAFEERLSLEEALKNQQVAICEKPGRSGQ